MDLKKKLGNRIREIRISRSLTQETLAEKINLSAKSLSQIELGNNFVSAQTLDALCSALSIEAKTLFEFNNNEIQSQDPLTEIIETLKNNKGLTETIYKIVLALN